MTQTASRLSRWERVTEWPLTFAALVFLGVYAWEVIANPGGAGHARADLVLNIVWVVFAVDYVVRFVLAPHRWHWFAHHLLDLAAVALPMLRPLRLLRLITVIALLQRSAGTALRGRITVYTVGSVVLLAFLGALAALDAERSAPGATITDFGKALWWAFVTITTVGYGDIAPVTLVGRCVAALLMVGGVALIGVVTATLASWIVSLVEEENAEEEAATRAQVVELQAQVAALTDRIDALLERRE